MTSNHVDHITVTVALASGDEHTLIVRAPAPQGGNPRFIGQQIEAAMSELGERLAGVANLYGDQVSGDTLPLPATVENFAKGMSRAFAHTE